MTPQEITKYQDVKESGMCDELELKWSRVDIGQSDSVRKALQADCPVCLVHYIKDVPEEVEAPAKPVDVDLETI